MKNDSENMKVIELQSVLDHYEGGDKTTPGKD